MFSVNCETVWMETLHRQFHQQNVNHPRQHSNQQSGAAAEGPTSVKHFCFSNRQKEASWTELCLSLGFVFCSLFVNATLGLLNQRFILMLHWQSARDKCWQGVTVLLFTPIRNYAPNNFVLFVRPFFPSFSQAEQAFSQSHNINLAMAVNSVIQG